MKLVAHTLVKNENRWIWFAINSVLDVVDEIMVWDTGSTDSTVEIIKSISSPKIKFKIRVSSTQEALTQARQEMLDHTQTDWLLILDGDEIWTPPALDQSLHTIDTQNPHYLINPYLNLIGDVYHHQENQAGGYHIGPHQGFVTIRFINLKKIGGIKYHRYYPDEAMMLSSTGEPIQNFSPDEAPFIANPFLHASNIKRTSLSEPDTIKKSHIYKYELGLPPPKDFSYPKSFYLSRSPIVSSPWTHRSLRYTLNAFWQTPLKYLKRRI